MKKPRKKINRKKKYEYIRVPESLGKGCPGNIYMDEITVCYSLN